MAVRQRLQCYIEPLILLSLSIFFLPYTALSHPLLLITSPLTTFRSKWFENLWRVIGPKMAASPVQVDHIEEIMSRARGTVLELGPGAGDQMYHFKTAEGRIDRVYGAEPNAFLHASLQENATKFGLGGRYTPLECGAQPGSLLPALKRAGLLPASAPSLPDDGVFDCVVAVKSLCSAPQDQLPSTVAVVQALLKPGGEFLFFEHLGNDSDFFTQVFAWLLDWIWPLFMGGCRLDGKLDAVINGMGGWSRRDMRNTAEYTGVSPFRYVRGICKKAF